MSCCGQDDPNSFSTQKDTWSKRSDLMMNNWDPYPEFLPPGERKYAQKVPGRYYEKYTVGNPSECGGAYKWGLQNVNQIPIGQRTLMLQEGYKKTSGKTTKETSKENYACGCAPQAYVPMSKTWGVQKRFDL